MKYSSFTFEDHIGMKIFVHKWSPDKSIEPKGLVCIIHGMAEHAIRYEVLAKALCQEGFICYAEDHRGHGKTMLPDKEGQLGEDGWDGVLLDLKYLMEKMKEENPNLPLFVYGHSWGSHLIQDFIQRFDLNLAGVALSGTSGSQYNLIVMKLIGNIIVKVQGKNAKSKFIYKQGVGPLIKAFPNEGSPNAWISSLKDEVKKYDDDPLCGFVPTNGYFYYWSQAMKRYWKAKNIAKIPKDLPIFLSIGTQDAFTEYGKRFQHLINRYEKAGLTNVEYKYYKDNRHEILNDISRDEFIKDLIKFFKKNC